MATFSALKNRFSNTILGINKTHQGYALRRTLKLVGYFFLRGGYAV